VRDELEALFRDTTLTVIAFAIALGWSLYQLVHGVAIFVDALTTHAPKGDSPYYSTSGSGLTWIVHHRIVSLDAIVTGLIEVALVLAVAAFVRRRYPARA
jgi:hypothetical protein